MSAVHSCGDGRLEQGLDICALAGRRFAILSKLGGRFFLVHSRAEHTGRSFDMRIGGRVPEGYKGVRQVLDGDWEFDELCIDDWFHLEQMDSRDWWLGVGNGEDYWHVNIHIDRDDKDERHLAPLQLGVIERCVKLWSAPGETVFSPFAGIGSEGYVALQLDRRFVGIELKPSYWEAAQRNLASAVSQLSLLAETS